MGKIQCSNGHFYDPSKHMSCPYCGIAIDDFEVNSKTVGMAPSMGNQPMNNNGAQAMKTQPVSNVNNNNMNNMGMGVQPMNNNGIGKTVPKSDFVEKQKSSAKTVAMVNVGSKEKSIEPVVGWLVCINGPEKGFDYRILAGRNKIGRGSESDICIKGDDAVSRDSHTEIIFDPNSKKFFLASGSGRGLTYLNGELVMENKLIERSDKIKVGNTELLFVPLCGEDFSWV